MHDAMFLELLRKQGLLPGNLQERIEVTLIKPEKVVLFMESSIERSLEGECIEPLCKFLTVMCYDENVQDDDALRKLAEKMIQQLDRETLLISTR